LNFHDFDFVPALMEGLDAMNYQSLTPIQEQAIPVIMKRHDLIASAQTGTGKTAAYLLPIVNDILEYGEEEHIQTLIIVPTRELAIQISQYIDGLSYFTSVSSIPVYGGSDGSAFAREQQALKHGADIVICTPGRMISHLNQGYVKIDGLKHLILDEADRMLDMGFNEDIMRIISYLPKKRQTLLFSATMPPKIRDLARKILIAPEEINIAISRPPETINQQAYVVNDSQKLALVKHLLLEKKLRSVIVFCSTKDNVKQLYRDLKKTELKTDTIHSDLEQAQREEVMRNFRNRSVSVLVATDILSRGIDVEDIDLVVNYDVPYDGEDYVHRIGRTARAESKGEAITLIGNKEHGRFKKIEQLLGYEVKKCQLPEAIGSSPEYKPSTHSGPKKNFYRKGNQGRRHGGGAGNARHKH